MIGSRAGVAALVMALAASVPAFAQERGRHLFVDAGVLAERDPTEFFSTSDFYGGSAFGKGGRAGIGIRSSEHTSFRLEVVVPAWHRATLPSSPTDHRSARTVSYSALYARRQQAGARVHIELLAGFTVEHRVLNESGTVDLQVSGEGNLGQQVAFSHTSVRNWPAFTLGADVDLRVTRHLSIVPQFRYDFFPYPDVSIVRGGAAARWRF